MVVFELSLTANKSHSSNITLMIIYYFSKTFQYPKILIYGLGYLVHYLKAHPFSLYLQFIYIFLVYSNNSVGLIAISISFLWNVKGSENPL